MTGDGLALRRALDFAVAANADSASPYYQRLDTERVGMIGHSQGGQGTIAAASDSRVDAVIMLNAGAPAPKPFLTTTGDLDILSPSSFAGHLTPVLEPQRLVDITTGFFRYKLAGDAAARDLFVGADCRLCDRAAELEYGSHGLE